VTPPPAARPDTAAAARPSRAAWLAFAPLAAVVGLRWVLGWLQDRAEPTPAWPLLPFAGAQDPWAWLPTAGLALLALAVALLILRVVRRRWGARALGGLLAALWIAAALAACAAQGLHFMNLRGLVPQAQPLAASVLGSRALAPSARGPGGTLLVLQLPGEAGPQQLLADDPGAARLAPGQALALQWSRGRWWGRYATGWQLAANPQVPASGAGRE